jgi:hypothetical protein
MDAIEPHWISLLWFAVFATVDTMALLVVAGMFPLSSRPVSARSGAATLLVAGNALLLSVLMIGTALFGYAELRLSSLIVATGLIVLFAPGLFELWPASLRDGWRGLSILVGAQMLALAALAKVAAPSWAIMS